MTKQDHLTTLEAPLSRSDLIAQRIRRAILEGDLEPGEPLVERELAGRFGVSKTPVREALISLAQTGLLTMNRQRGYSVTLMLESDITSSYEVRLRLEPYAIGKAAKVWTSDDSDRVETILDAADQAGREKKWTDLSMLNRQFHRELYSRASGDLLVSILDNLQDRVALMGVESWRNRPTWSREGLEHRQILAAVASNDDATAESIAFAHVSSFADLILKIRTDEISVAVNDFEG